MKRKEHDLNQNSRELYCMLIFRGVVFGDLFLVLGKHSDIFGKPPQNAEILQGRSPNISKYMIIEERKSGFIWVALGRSILSHPIFLGCGLRYSIQHYAVRIYCPLCGIIRNTSVENMRKKYELCFFSQTTWISLEGSVKKAPCSNWSNFVDPGFWRKLQNLWFLWAKNPP